MGVIEVLTNIRNFAFFLGEYWVVHPYEETVIAYVLDEQGKYAPIRPNPFVNGELVPVGVFNGFEVDLGKVFPDI